MADINVAALAMVDADPDRVRRSIADYRKFRPAILTSHFYDYEVLEGGQGAGTRVRWILNPGRWTKRRARVWEMSAEESDGALIERDANSSAVLTWEVVRAPDGRSAVKMTLVFTAPDGLGGMRARSRGNRERRLYGEMLFQLRKWFTDCEPDSDGVDNTGTATDGEAEPSEPTDSGK